jgi:hypothetical protein
VASSLVGKMEIERERERERVRERSVWVVSLKTVFLLLWTVLVSRIYLQQNKAVLTNKESAGCHVHCFFFTCLVLYFPHCHNARFLFASENHYQSINVYLL